MKRGGTTTVPPEANVARVEATKPWTWNNGIMQRDTSSGVRLYVFTMFATDTVKLYVYHNEGGTENLEAGQSNVWLSGSRIGAL